MLHYMCYISISIYYNKKRLPRKNKCSAKWSILSRIMGKLSSFSNKQNNLLKQDGPNKIEPYHGSPP